MLSAERLSSCSNRLTQTQGRGEITYSSGKKAPPRRIFPFFVFEQEKIPHISTI